MQNLIGINAKLAQLRGQKFRLFGFLSGALGFLSGALGFLSGALGFLSGALGFLVSFCQRSDCYFFAGWEYFTGLSL